MKRYLAVFAACVLAVRALEQSRRGRMKFSWALGAIVFAALVK